MNTNSIIWFSLFLVATSFIVYLLIIIRSGSRLQQLATVLQRLNFPPSALDRIRRARSAREVMDSLSIALEEEVEGLRRKLQMQTETARNISHDLGGPLTSILGYTQTLLERGERVSADERARYLEIINRNTVTLRSMVQRFLELTSLEDDAVRIELGPCSARKIVEQIYEQFIPIAGEKGVRLECKRPEEELLNRSEVLADSLLILRALSNLVQNSISYTPRGGVVEISIRLLDDTIQFSVSDSGVGVPSSEHAKIFEAFYRVGKERGHETGGMGLGLAIVRRILDLHGTRAHIASEPGKGTTVSFRLPRALGIMA